MLGGVIDRAGLADFLRRRRELLRPAEVGLPPGARRRTPGLRREEVAALAGVSADYYTRLEQARGPHPSASVVAAVARALRCEVDERDHLFHLAGLTPPPRRAGRHIPPGLMRLVDHLTEVPVLVLSDLTEVLWQNRLADALTGPLAPEPGAPTTGPGAGSPTRPCARCARPRTGRACRRRTCATCGRCGRDGVGTRT